MDKLHTIQCNVPICPECGGALKFQRIINKYLCMHCGTRFKIIGVGQTEREFICEKENNNGSGIFVS